MTDIERMIKAGLEARSISDQLGFVPDHYDSDAALKETAVRIGVMNALQGHNQLPEGGTYVVREDSGFVWCIVRTWGHEQPCDNGYYGLRFPLQPFKDRSDGEAMLHRYVSRVLTMMAVDWREDVNLRLVFSEEN